VSGRHEQLARQIRRLRTSASEPGRTLQRAVHLALDLANEDDESDFAALAAKGVLDGDLAARLGALCSAERLSARDVTPQVLIDLDVFLRSVEIGRPAPPLQLAPLDAPPKLPPGAQRSSVNVSGRVISVIGRDGRAMVVVDDRPVGMMVHGDRVPHFGLQSVPMSTHQVDRDDDGMARIEWPGLLRLRVELDFETVHVEIPR
jgi:hypothetical protein